MTKEEKIINLIVDLIFDKHCKMKEYARDQERLECDNLLAMKKELKEKLNEALSDD